SVPSGQSTHACPGSHRADSSSCWCVKNRLASESARSFVPRRIRWPNVSLSAHQTTLPLRENTAAQRRDVSSANRIALVRIETSYSLASAHGTSRFTSRGLHRCCAWRAGTSTALVNAFALTSLTLAPRCCSRALLGVHMSDSDA